MGEFLQQFPTVLPEMAVQALEEAKDSLIAEISCWSASNWTSGIALPIKKRAIAGQLDTPFGSPYAETYGSATHARSKGVCPPSD